MGGDGRDPLRARIDQRHARRRGHPHRAGAVRQEAIDRRAVRWGLENLNLTAERLKQLGFEGVLQPIKVSCADHEGARVGRIQTWDGKDWKVTSDWYTSDDSVIAPMVKEVAAKYAAEKKITTGCLLTH